MQLWVFKGALLSFVQFAKPGYLKKIRHHATAGFLTHFVLNLLITHHFIEFTGLTISHHSYRRPHLWDKTGIRQRELGQLWNCGQFEIHWSPEVLCGLLIVCWKGGLWKRLSIFYVGDWWSLRWAWRSSWLRSLGPKTTLHGWGTFHMRATVTENAISSGNEGQVWNSYLTNLPLGHCDAGPMFLFKQKPS